MTLKGVRNFVGVHENPRLEISGQEGHHVSHSSDHGSVQTVAPTSCERHHHGRGRGTASASERERADGDDDLGTRQ